MEVSIKANRFTCSELVWSSKFNSRKEQPPWPRLFHEQVTETQGCKYSREGGGGGESPEDGAGGRAGRGSSE